MSRRAFVGLVICLVATALAAAAPPAMGQARYLWVNTTEDLPLESGQCLPGQVCTLRRALELADGHQGIITACFEEAAVRGARQCPAGALPLTTQDPNYDATTGRWSIAVGSGSVSLVLARGGTAIDFSYGIQTWSGAKDNRVVLDGDLGRDPSSPARTDIILVEGTDNVIRGLEVRGSYQVSAIIVRQGAANNQFGPGLVLASMPQGAGLTFENRETVGNKVVGCWCGLTGDGTQVAPLADDCIRFTSGASASIVGGLSPEDRNVLVASGRGVGVSVEGRATRDITIQGNYIGVGPDGATAVGNEAGIRIVDGASGVRVADNVIAGNRNNGIAVFGESTGIAIEDNRIGLGASGNTCVTNAGTGISLEGGVSDSAISHNAVQCNSDGGIVLRDATIQAVLITENSLSRNQGKPLLVAEGANMGVKPPTIEPQEGGVVRGKTCPGCTVELFTDPSGEAEVFEGSIKASDTDGTFVFEKSQFAYRALRGTATDAGNTSALSEEVYLPREPRPTNTEFGYRTPTPPATLTSGPTETGGPTRPPASSTPQGFFRLAFLPWAHHGPMLPGRDLDAGSPAHR